jgi:thiosulfate dehydrogenase
MKRFLVGFLLGVVAVAGGLFYYFYSGMAPVATSDPPMPFEKRMANMALNAHLERQTLPPPPVQPDEQNLLAGADIYQQHCAMCHGLPNQTKPIIQQGMYPPPTELFRGKGVTDDPPSESYWKALNGIRLSGMPSFKSGLNETQLWQVSLLVAHANDLPESVKKALVPQTPPSASQPASKQKN